MAFSRDRFWALLKAAPRDPLQVISTSHQQHDGYAVEALRFELEGGEPMRGFVARPTTPGPHPALLYMHSHGGKYHIGADEMLLGHDYIGPLGPVFARAGFVTLMVEMPLFGTRANVSESALSKALLWRGRTLMGQMLSELTGALGYLAARPDVDAARIGAFGISMGCTHGFMLAALDDRIKALTHLCCYADYDVMIDLGLHDMHGHYLTIPGLLAETSVGEICGAIAPRSQLICIGADDPLTAPAAVARARGETEAAYRAAGHAEALEIFIEPGVKHQETTAMRQKFMAFFQREL
jgi:cephalosporin-C deacetylase-like acetyl esterase